MYPHILKPPPGVRCFLAVVSQDTQASCVPVPPNLTAVTAFVRGSLVLTRWHTDPVRGEGSASGLDFVICYQIYCVQTHTWTEDVFYKHIPENVPLGSRFRHDSSQKATGGTMSLVYILIQAKMLQRLRLTLFSDSSVEDMNCLGER